MSAGLVANRYAKGLLQAFDAAGLAADAVRPQWQALEVVFADRDAHRVLHNPSSATALKRELLALVNPGEGPEKTLFASFLNVVVDAGRIEALPAVGRFYLRELEERSGAIAVEITSAAALSSDQEAGLRSALQKILARRPEMSAQVDPALLGGVVIRAGNQLMDLSLRKKLADITTLETAGG